MNAKVQIVGIINATPDSFYEGSRAGSLECAVAQAGRMLQEGADILEIGGESTGPRSKDISMEEERSRVLPVIRAIREAHPEASLAVDTYKAAVARAAIAEGVRMVNDVTAGRGDPDFFPTVASADVRVVLMFAKDPSARTTLDEREYEDVIAHIKAFLGERRAAAIAAGIAADRIILDPGLGHFVSARPEYSFQVLARLEEFQELGCPLFLSPSRKSFLAGALALKTVERLPGTIAASAIAVLHGASYIRTHDVAAVRAGVEVAELTKSARLLP